MSAGESDSWDPWSEFTPDELAQHLRHEFDDIERDLESIPTSGDVAARSLEALTSLRLRQPTAAELQARTRSAEIEALAQGIVKWAQAPGGDAAPQQRTRRLLLALQLCRLGLDDGRLTPASGHVLAELWKDLLRQGMREIGAGTRDASSVLQGIETSLRRVLGVVPPKTILEIRQEITRQVGVPAELQWGTRGEATVQAVDATSVRRDAVAAMRRPGHAPSLPALMAPMSSTATDARSNLATVGDVVPERVIRALAGREAELVSELRAELAPMVLYQVPASVFRPSGQRDADFGRACDQLTTARTLPAAVTQFEALVASHPASVIVKEWYAYALHLADSTGNRARVRELLEELAQAQLHRDGPGWTVRVNLAKLVSEDSDQLRAFGLLEDVIVNRQHPPQALDMCVRIALDTSNPAWLSKALVLHRSFNAHLLYVLNLARSLESGSPTKDDLRNLQRQVADCLARHGSAPEPLRRLETADIREVLRQFITSGRVSSGVAWFRQRLTNSNYRPIPENWAALADLLERAGHREEAWAARQNQLMRALTQPAEGRLFHLEEVLQAGLRLGMGQPALQVLASNWQGVRMTQPRMEQLRDLLTRGGRGAPALPAKKSAAPNPPTGIRARDEAQEVLHKLAGTFRGAHTVESLLARADDANRLIDAAVIRDPDVPQSAILSLRRLLELFSTFAGASPRDKRTHAKEMAEQLQGLELLKEPQWWNLQGLAASCNTAVMRLANALTLYPDLTLAPTLALRLAHATDAPHSTRAWVRVMNPAAVAATDLTLRFRCGENDIQVSADPVRVDALAERASRVVECPLDVLGRNPRRLDLGIEVSYRIENLPRTVDLHTAVELVEPFPPIPSSERYVNTRYVGLDRSDLFRGRQQELDELSQAFPDLTLRTLYFVNGIRGVGKTTLLAHLGRHLGPGVMTLLLDLGDAIGEGHRDATEIVLRLVRDSIESARKAGYAGEVTSPARDSIDRDPWGAFELFLSELRRSTGVERLLVCFDEMQVYVQHAEDAALKVSGFLTWLRRQVRSRSELLIVCSGSEPYDFMTARFKHGIWHKELARKDISFVDLGATSEIAQVPVQRDGVEYLPEAMTELWDMTSGHPWVTQIVAEFVARLLNKEGRRFVLPGDILRAVEESVRERPAGLLWWNEEEGFLTKRHRDIAFLILKSQAAPRVGVPESMLRELCEAAKLGDPRPLLEHMRILETVEQTMAPVGGKAWRVRSGYLERWLALLMESQAERATVPQNVFLAMDWENLWLSLQKQVESFSDGTRKQGCLRHLGNIEALAKELVLIATLNGVANPSPVAVADWDMYAGHQRALERALVQTRFGASGTRNGRPAMGVEKAINTDHVVRELFRGATDVDVFILGAPDGDYAKAIEGLLLAGKQVIMWYAEDALNATYKGYILRGLPLTLVRIDQVLFDRWGLAVQEESPAAR